jgi:hypothetical protein
VETPFWKGLLQTLSDAQGQQPTDLLLNRSDKTVVEREVMIPWLIEDEESTSGSRIRGEAPSFFVP